MDADVGHVAAVASASATEDSACSDAERIDGCKARLATLVSHEAELDVELSELEWSG